MRAGIAGFIGFVIGVGAGYFGASRFIRKKAEEEHAHEVNEIVEYYENKYVRKEPAVTKEEPVPKPTAVYHEDESLNKGMPVDKRTYDQIISYSKPYKSSTVLETVMDPHATLEEMVTRLAEEEAPEEKPKSKEGPKLIKVSDYGNDPSLERITLYYYTEDGAITNDEEERIEVDIARMMIGNAIEKFDFANSNEPSIYVRNRKYGADYEIIKVRGAYDP